MRRHVPTLNGDFSLTVYYQNGKIYCKQKLFTSCTETVTQGASDSAFQCTRMNARITYTNYLDQYTVTNITVEVLNIFYVTVRQTTLLVPLYFQCLQVFGIVCAH